MGTRAAVSYRWQGPVMLRASTSPGIADLPRTLDLDDVAVTRMWLGHIWQQEAFRNALRAATPVLSEAVEAVAGGQETRLRQVRRTALSTVSYLLRWQNRCTPLGLFAGTAVASVGKTAHAWWGEKHRVLLRADAEWVTEAIGRLQASPELLRRLSLTANNTARERGDRLIALGAPADAYAPLLAPVEVSVRNSRPVAAAVAAAREPAAYHDLHARLRILFPQAAADQIDRLLRDLIDQQFLLSNLWAPMTTVDAFGHLCAELERHGADTIPDVHGLVTALYGIRDGIAADQPTSASTTLDRLVPAMRAVAPATPTPLTVETGLDCDVRIPATVLEEVQAAVTALYRTTTQPYGYQHWREYHRRFRARYGAGAQVPVLELISDSGLGLPAGYLGSARTRPPEVRTDRDEVILALLEHVLLEGRSELVLTDKVVTALAEAAGTEPHFVPRVETAFTIHAPSTAALTRGDFEITLTAVPRPGSSMAGRFAHLLTPGQQDALAAGYVTDPDALTAQLSFAPRKRRNENVIRTPRLLPHVVAVGEHRPATDETIALDDIAVIADARHLHLVRRSTGQRLDVRVAHALEAATQTPALARFLAEVAEARYAAYKPFGFGAAARLPYLPRVRYRRTILAPARWLLTAEELPGRTAGQETWDKAFDAWRDRLRVPEAVSMVEYDQRLPIDLTHPVHRRLLRTRLDQDRRMELREAPAADAYGWIGRAHEVWVALHRATPVPAPRSGFRPASSEPRLHLPGAGTVLYARLHAHPGRYDEILTHHLPVLLAELGGSAPLWWFTRHRETARPDADQHLDLVLHLAPGNYAAAAEQVHDWAGTLHRTGLAAGLTLADYRPQTGRFGHSAAMEAAHRVFAADSAAALAQIRLTERTGNVTPQALAAASVLGLVQHLAPSETEGTDWLVRELPQPTGRLDPQLRDQVLDLTSPEGRNALGDETTEAWRARATALNAYRTTCTEPLRAARSLLHQHHVRALGADPAAEALTVRLARTAALRQQKATR